MSLAGEAEARRARRQAIAHAADAPLVRAATVTEAAMSLAGRGRRVADD